MPVVFISFVSGSAGFCVCVFFLLPPLRNNRSKRYAISTCIFATPQMLYWIRWTTNLCPLFFCSSRFCIVVVVVVVVILQNKYIMQTYTLSVCTHIRLRLLSLHKSTTICAQKLNVYNFWWIIFTLLYSQKWNGQPINARTNTEKEPEEEEVGNALRHEDEGQPQ